VSNSQIWVIIGTEYIGRCKSNYGWPLRNINISNDNGQWIFDFLRRFFLSSVTDKTFTKFDYIYIYIWVTWQCLIRSRHCLLFTSPHFFGGVHVAHLFSFLWCVFVLFVCVSLPLVLSNGVHVVHFALLFVFTFVVPYCDARIKRCLVHLDSKCL